MLYRRNEEENWLMMKKRGDTIGLWFIIELVAAIALVFLGWQTASNYSQGRIYEKVNLAKDLAMQINTLQSIPGDAYIINNNLNDYSVLFLDNKVEVFENEFDQTRGIYYFAPNINVKLDVKLVKPNQLVLIKTGNEIKVSDKILSLN